MFWSNRIKKERTIMYSYAKTIKKGVKYFVIFALPVLVDKLIISYPEIFQLTIGGVLLMGTDYLKNRMKITLGGLL